MQSTQNLIVIDIKKSIFLTFFYLRTAAMPAFFKWILLPLEESGEVVDANFVDDFL